MSEPTMKKQVHLEVYLFKLKFANDVVERRVVSIKQDQIKTVLTSLTRLQFSRYRKFLTPT